MKALLIDDNDALRQILSLLLEDEGLEVSAVGSLTEARARLAAGGFGLVLLDVHLRDGLGTDLVPEIRRLAPQAKVAIMSGTAPSDLLAVDADLILDKVGDPEAMLASLRRLVAPQG
jgi:DNA-binding NtrC family response regulator